ncbi:Uncharacterised protein [Klebsiella pneumoniae]|nr:Uncharacterised protein [Klebsiella pneumoniae]
MAAAKAQGADRGADVEQVIGPHQFSLQNGGRQAQMALLHAVGNMFRANAQPDAGLIPVARRQRMALFAKLNVAVNAGER